MTRRIIDDANAAAYWINDALVHAHAVAYDGNSLWPVAVITRPDTRDTVLTPITGPIHAVMQLASIHWYDDGSLAGLTDVAMKARLCADAVNMARSTIFTDDEDQAVYADAQPIFAWPTDSGIDLYISRARTAP